MTIQFTNALQSIEERVQSRKRLTLKQGSLLLVAYQQAQEQLQSERRQMEQANKRYLNLLIQLEYETETLGRRITELNEMYAVLDRVFGFKVYSKDGDTWIIEYEGKTSTGHASVAAAYEAVLKESIAH